MKQLALLILAAACSSDPAHIKVKLPKDSPQAFKDTPTPPVFRKKGERLQLRASAFNARQTYMGPAKVKWSSSDPAVAVVDDKGEVSITGSGSAFIVATGDGYGAALESRLEVKARIVESVTIVAPKDFKRIKIRQEVKLAADVRDDKGNAVTDARVFWSNPDHGVWVHADGVISGAALGESTVIAEAEGKVAQISFAVVD